MAARVSFFAAGVFAFALTTPARADDKQVCSAAYTQAQIHRDAHELLKARAQLRICTRVVCTWRAADCAKWLGEVEAAIPTIVFEVRDAGGGDLSSVRVSVDGASLADRLDGTALAIDPGEHTFRFEADGLPTVEKKLVIRESEKGRRERVVLGAATAKTEQRALTQPATPPDEGSSRTPTAAYVAFGVGGVGLVVGVVFTVLAVSANNGNSGACLNFVCPHERDTKTANDTVMLNSTFAGVGFGVAVLGAGIGTILLLTSSDSAKTSASTGAVRIAPTLGIGWAGIDGRF